MYPEYDQIITLVPFPLKSGSGQFCLCPHHRNKPGQYSTIASQSVGITPFPPEILSP